MTFHHEAKQRGKKRNDRPGTLAACCKPSSGAGVVWMSSRHRMLVGTLPATKRRPPLGLCATLPLSHFTRALECRKNEARRAASQVKLQVSLERKVAGSSLEEDVATFLSFPR